MVKVSVGVLTSVRNIEMVEDLWKPGTEVSNLWSDTVWIIFPVQQNLIKTGIVDVVIDTILGATIANIP